MAANLLTVRMLVYPARNERSITTGRNGPEYTAITEKRATISSIGPIDENDCMKPAKVPFSEILCNSCLNLLHLIKVHFTKYRSSISA